MFRNSAEDKQSLLSSDSDSSLVTVPPDSSPDTSPDSPAAKAALKRAQDVKRASRISIFINNKNVVSAPDKHHDNVNQQQAYHNSQENDSLQVQNSGVMASVKKFCGCK